MATRQFDFIVGPETSTLPSAGTPSSSGDLITLGYADGRYTQGSASVADVTGLKAIGSSDRIDGDFVLVRSTNYTYRFDSSSVATGDDNFFVTPSAGSGRWIRLTILNQAVNFTDTTQSTNKDTGAIVLEGGMGIEKNLNVGGNAIVTGNLTVSGTTTTINSTTLDVVDPNITVNKGGSTSTANSAVSGITVETSATSGRLGYDSTLTSRFKAGDSGSESEIITAAGTQSLTGTKTFSAITSFSNTTQSTNKDTGCVVLEGGLGIEKDTFTGGDITIAGLTASRAVATDSNKKLVSSATTSAELAFVNGVTSSIQTQIDAKAATTYVDSQDALRQPLATLTTKGDLYVATASSTVTRQPVGADGTVLTADSAQASGIKWGTALSNPMTSVGDIIVGGTAGAATRLAIGATGTVLHGGTTPSYSQIVNADVASAAAIAGTKISPDFGSQTVLTTGSVGVNNASPGAKIDAVVGGTGHTAGDAMRVTSNGAATNISTVSADSASFTGRNLGLFTRRALNSAYEAIAFVAGDGSNYNVTNGFKVRGDGQVEAVDGSVGTPAYSFLSDTDLGIYRSATNELSISAGNSQAVIVTNANGTGIKGTTTNDSAASGFVGETAQAQRVRSAGTSASAGSAAFDVTSLSLTAGQWFVTGVVGMQPAGTSSTNHVAAISTTSATLPGSDVIAVPTSNQMRVQIGGYTVTGSDIYIPIPSFTVKLSATTTIYLVAAITYTGTAPLVHGSINAVRIR